MHDIHTDLAPKNLVNLFVDVSDVHTRCVRRGGALGARAPPPPNLEKSSAQKCSKEERKLRPDMAAKRKVHVPLRYDKIKTKKVGKKEDKSKRKGIKLKK